MDASRDVLIVDDDDDLSSLLAECLRAEGYTIRVADNGERGLDLLRDRLPGAVVLDVEMPVLDGPGMVHRMIIEDCGKELIPIVLVSGAATFHALVARVGTPYFVAKPCDLESVLVMLRRALAERVAPVPTDLPSGSPRAA